MVLDAGLKKFLKKNATGDTLAVLDAKLGNIIKEKLEIPCIFRFVVGLMTAYCIVQTATVQQCLFHCSNGVMEMTRGIRSQLQGLIRYDNLL